MGRVTRRDEILLAAAIVINRDGAEGFTLEAVAHEAGITKGGLFYHFRTKEDLAAALIDHLVGEVALDLDQAPEGAFTRTYISAIRRAAVADSRLSAALTLALAVNPELLRPLRERYAQWSQLLERENPDPLTALLIRLAIDGLWLNDVLELTTIEDHLRQQLIQRLTPGMPEVGK